MNKVILGMSGGVDSSTAAYLLKKQGYEVIGVTLNQHKDTKNKDIVDAKKICDFLGIKHKVLNIYDEFNEKVIKYFIESYDNGQTPSPCLICDDEIKFKYLFQVADEENAEYVATGHYASVEYCEYFGKYLLKGVHNIIKDQSYMLYRLNENRVKRLIFPLKSYSKAEIRKIAKEANIEVHDKKDSQGICFAKEGYIDFLYKNLGTKIKEGNFIDKNGKILGRHKGYQLYTLGQRRGLGINFSKPIFITKIKAESNEIILGDYEDLYISKVEIRDYKFNVDLEKIIGMELDARPRFSSLGFKGKLIIEENKLYFVYNEKNTHNAEGQHLVIFYNKFVLGGGIIKFIAKE